MTATDHAPHVDPGKGWLKEDWVYIKTALWLGVLTAIEVFTYFESVHEAPEELLIIVLVVLMVVKFALVVAVFMHLRDDHAIFTKMLVMGLCIAWPVYAVAALAFGWLDWHWTVKTAIVIVPPVITGWTFGKQFQGGSGQH